MANSETKNAQGQTSEQQSGQQQAGPRSGAMQNRRQGGQGRGLTRRNSYAPIVFSLSPREILSVSPFELMRQFSEELDRVFEDFGVSAQGGAGSSSQMATWSPSIEVFQHEENLVVRAELPGVNKEDVKIELTDDGLVIQGERKQEHEENREGFYRSERSYGRFYRLIALPENINADQVRAEFNNGVLEVTVPVEQEQERKREIPIGAQSGEQSSGEQSQAASAKQTQS